MDTLTRPGRLLAGPTGAALGGSGLSRGGFILYCPSSQPGSAAFHPAPATGDHRRYFRASFFFFFFLLPFFSSGFLGRFLLPRSAESRALTARQTIALLLHKHTRASLLPAPPPQSPPSAASRLSPLARGQYLVSVCDLLRAAQGAVVSRPEPARRLPPLRHGVVCEESGRIFALCVYLTHI